MERLQRVRMHLPERLSSCLRVRTPVSQRTQRGPSEREIARPSAWNHRHFQDSLRKRLWPSHNSETESIERQVTQHRLGRTYRVFDRAHTRVQKAPLRSHSSDNAGPIVNFGRTFPVTPRQWCKSRRRFFKCTRQLWHGPVLSGQPVRLRAGRKNFPLRTAKSTGQLRPAQATFPVKRPQRPVDPVSRTLVPGRNNDPRHSLQTQSNPNWTHGRRYFCRISRPSFCHRVW